MDETVLATAGVGGFSWGGTSSDAAKQPRSQDLSSSPERDPGNEVSCENDRER